MAEQAPRNPRSIAEKLGEPGGAGKVIEFCGRCGLPKSHPLCTYGPDTDPRVKGAVSAGSTLNGEPIPAKLSGG